MFWYCVKLNFWEILQISFWVLQDFTAWKVYKNGVVSGPYFPVFGLNTGKYGPAKAPYLDIFHAVFFFSNYFFFETLKYFITDYFLQVLSPIVLTILKKVLPSLLKKLNAKFEIQIKHYLLKALLTKATNPA